MVGKVKPAARKFACNAFNVPPIDRTSEPRCLEYERAFAEGFPPDFVRDGTCLICGGVTFKPPVQHFCPQSFFPRLLRDECLIRVLKPERMTVTGRLWIPETAQRADFEMYQAVVLATGPGRRKKSGELNPVEVKIGDHCLIFWHHVAGQSSVRYMDRDDLRIIAQWQMQLHWPASLTLAEAMR